MAQREGEGLKTVVVYGGSRAGKNPLFLEKAAGLTSYLNNHLYPELGSYLASKKIDVVYGGSKFGLLGAVSEAVIAKHGKLTGIVPDFFTKKPHYEAASEEIVVPDMHTRKKMMFDKADAFIAMPGGLGTMEELTEILTWLKLRLHSKPVGILNSGGYYDYFLQWVSHSIAEGFISSTGPEELMVISSEPVDLVDRLCLRVQESACKEC